MNDGLLQRLRVDNPWLGHPDEFPARAAHRVPKRWIPRHVASMESWPVAGRAVLLIGARQVGKSSLIWRWLSQHGAPPLYLNAEEHLVRQWCTSAARVRGDLAELVAQETPIFLDEAQHLDEAGLLIKGLVDGGLPNPLFVTGSSAFHLRARTRESLAGRAVRVELHPLSLAELAQGGGEMPPLLQRQRARELADRQLARGSYPVPWQSEAPDTALFELLEAFVIRDASDLYQIREVGAFRTLLGLLARQVGDLVNYSEWASICGVARSTISGWVDLLTESHIVERVAPFAGGRRAELTGRPKVFFRDVGLRNALLGPTTPFETSVDRGKRMECWVFAELRKHLSGLHPMDAVRYWRSKGGAEVDFVLQRPSGLLAVEAKAGALAPGRLPRSARSFLAAYAPARLVVVHLGEAARFEVGDTEVLLVGPEAFAEPEGILSSGL